MMKIPGDVVAVQGSLRLIYDEIGDDGWAWGHLEQDGVAGPEIRILSALARGGWTSPPVEEVLDDPEVVL